MSARSDRRHLEQQFQGWYVRVKTPKDLQRLFHDYPDTRPAGIGRYATVVTLNTRDFRTAQERRWDVIATIKRRFDELRASHLSTGRDDDGRLAFQRTLERLRGEAAGGLWPPESREELEDRLEDTVHKHPGAGEFGGGPGTPVWDAYAEFVRPGYVDPTRYAPPIAELAERYLKDRQRDPGSKVTEQTVNQERAVLELFGAFMGTQGLPRVTRQLAVEFLDTITGLDPLWARSPAKRKATLAQLAGRSVTPHPEGLSNRTINRYVSTLSTFMGWASDRYPNVLRDAFAGQWRKASSTRKTGWLPMSDADVLTLLVHADTLEHSDPMAWIIRVGAYSGMRLNEICGRKVRDVIRRDGVLCFNVHGAKTEAGDRVVPVHSQVLQAGFLAYLETLPADGPLFPTLKPGGPDGKLSWTVTQDFTRLRRKLGITGERLCFHSLRKSFTTKLERAHVPPTEAAQLLGHERGFTFTTYSSGLRPSRLKELIELVRYSADAAD